jgi:hypothetical protein
LLDNAVKDGGRKSQEAVSSALHSLQVKNELLHHKNKDLRNAFTTRKKHKKKSNTMNLHQRKEYQSSAVFWSPRKVRKAQVRKGVKQQEAEEEKLQKSHCKELNAAAALYKKQQLAEAKAEQERVKIVKQREREQKTERLAAFQVKKQRQKGAANTQKALQLSQRGKKPASQKPASKPKRVRRAVEVQDGVEAAEATPAALLKSSQTCTIKALNRYSD